MKVNTMQVANALGLTSAIFWVLCSLFYWLFPGLALILDKWWLHNRNISVLGTPNLDLTTFILGGITFTVFGWLFGYVLGWSLKYFEK